MEFQQVVRKRKMVRSFEDRPVPDELVERLVGNALRAPSAGYSQGWAFLVLRGREEVERYWSAHKSPGGNEYARFPQLFDAPVLVICLSHERVYRDRYALPDKRLPGQPERSWPVPYWHVDTGMAALLLLLTAVDLGLGALLFEVPRQSEVRAVFGIPDEYTAVGTVAIGYPAADLPSTSSKRAPRDKEDVVHYGRW